MAEDDATRRAAVTRARAAAAQAASQAEVTIRLASTNADLRRLTAVLAEVWDAPDPHTIVPPNLLRALEHAGSYVTVVEHRAPGVTPTIIGGTIAFLGWHDRTPHVHSHITGFVAEHTARGVGWAAKLDQRAWALEQGIDVAAWTFDPLVRANAWFNLSKLGAHLVEYLPLFYGRMDDGVNAGDETDRLLVEWHLLDPAVADAAEGHWHLSAVSALRDRGARVLLDVGTSGTPVAGSPVSDTDRVLLCRTPADILGLRGRDPDAARQWRRALRDTLGAAINAGWTVAGFTRDGFYVLDRSEG